MPHFKAILVIIVILSISHYSASSSSITPVEDGEVKTKSGEEFSTILTNNPEINESYQDITYFHSLDVFLGEDAIVEVQVYNNATSNHNLYLYIWSLMKILEFNKELPRADTTNYYGKTTKYYILKPNVNWTVTVKLTEYVEDFAPILFISLPNKPNSTLRLIGGDLPDNVTVWVTSKLTILDRGKKFNFVLAFDKSSIVLIPFGMIISIFYPKRTKRNSDKLR